MPLDGKFRDNVMRPGQERRHRLPAARAVPSAVRRHAQHTAWCWRCRSPRNISASPRTSPISAPLYEEVLHADTYAQGPGLDGGAGDRRLAVRQHADRHGGVANIGTDRNWTRLGVQPGQLVRLRPAGLGSIGIVARHRRGLGAHDLLQRSRIRRTGRGHDDGVARGGGRLHDAARPGASDGDGTSLWAGAVGERV